MRTGLAIPATLSSIKPLSLNQIDSICNEYMELLNQFPELTRLTMKGETVKHGITHKIVTKGHPVFARPRRLVPYRIQDFTQRLAGSKIFSKIAFFQFYTNIIWVTKFRTNFSTFYRPCHAWFGFRVCIFRRLVNNKP